MLKIKHRTCSNDTVYLNTVVGLEKFNFKSEISCELIDTEKSQSKEHSDYESNVMTCDRGINHDRCIGTL